MANLKSQTPIIFFIVAAISIISPTHCSRIRMILPNDESLIESTCKQTPHYDLCVQSLKSDPASSGADVAGLGLIMVKVITSKAKATSGKINQLLHGGHVKPKQENALRSCSEMYDMALETFIPEANEALKEGNPKFAEDGVKGVLSEADSCEEEFSGTGVASLLTPENSALRDLSAVAVAIVRLLL